MSVFDRSRYSPQHFAVLCCLPETTGYLVFAFLWLIPGLCVQAITLAMKAINNSMISRRLNRLPPQLQHLLLPSLKLFLDPLQLQCRHPHPKRKPHQHPLQTSNPALCRQVLKRGSAATV